MNTNTTVIYVDMDHVLCDYDLGYKAHKAKYPDLPFPQSQPGLPFQTQYVKKEWDNPFSLYRNLTGSPHPTTRDLTEWLVIQ